MVRIVHLSDLHFGRDRPELITPLVDTVNSLGADLVAVSGDMSQRARHSEFGDAAALLARLDPPNLVVPGNHDVPLWNVLFRILRPFKRYRRYFGDNKEPDCTIEDVAVVGVNSVDPHAHQRGLLSSSRIGRTVDRLSALDEGLLKIVVMHHPIVHPEGSDKEPMIGAQEAARAFSDAGADVVLSGHLHTWGAETFEMPGGRALLFVQAGTGLSTRVRGEPNDFNVLDCAPGAVEVTRYSADDPVGPFLPQPSDRFVDSVAGWVRDRESPSRIAAGLR